MGTSVICIIVDVRSQFANEACHLPIFEFEVTWHSAKIHDCNDISIGISFLHVHHVMPGIDTVCSFKSAYTAEQTHRTEVVCVLFKTQHKTKSWMTYVSGLSKLLGLLNTKFPQTAMLLFLDDAANHDPAVNRLLTSLRGRGPEEKQNVSVFGFRCSDFLHNGIHKQLFATLVRFFPMFQKRKRPEGSCVATLDVEPGHAHVASLHRIIEVAVRFNAGRREKLALVYAAKEKHFVDEWFLSVKATPLPYVEASGVVAFASVRSDSMTRLLADVRSNRLGRWVYGPLKGAFDYGIDEIYTNQYLLPDVYDRGQLIGYFATFDLAAVLFYARQYLLKCVRTHEFLAYMLDVRSNERSVEEMLSWIDSSFRVGSRVKVDSHVRTRIAQRFWRVLDECLRTDCLWFPRQYMEYLSLFSGATMGSDFLVVNSKGLSPQVVRLDGRYGSW